MSGITPDANPLQDHSIGDPVTAIAALTPDETAMTSSYRDLRDKSEEIQVGNVLARPRLLFTEDVNVGMTLNLLLEWKVLAPVASFIANWRLFRGRPKVTVQFVGSPSVMGVYRFWFVPTVLPDGYNPTTLEWNPNRLGVRYSQYYSYPTMDLNLSTECTCTMELPFPAIRTFLDLGAVENDWIMYGGPLHPQVNVNDLTPAVQTFRVYLSYEDVEFQRLIEQSGDGLDEVSWSSALAYAAALTSRLPFYFATPATKALNAGAAAATIMGWSRPPAEAHSATVVRHNSSFAPMSGQPDLSFHLGVDPVVARDVSGRVYPKLEVGSDIRQLLNTWGHWFSAQSPLIPLDGVSMNPRAMNPDSILGGNVMSMTPLAFVTSMFEEWTGSIEVKVVVSGSPLVRWQLGIMVIPPVNTGQPLTFQGHGDYLTHIMDIAGTVEYTFMVPYLHKNSFKGVQRPIPHIASPGIGDCFLAFYSLTDPTGPSATPVYPYIDVYTRAGPDFAVGVPSMAQYVGCSLTEQSGAGLGAQSVARFGEEITDLTQLAKRFMQSFVLLPLAVRPTAIYLPVNAHPPTHPGVVLDATDPANYFLTFSSFIRFAFFGFSGSSCWKVMNVPGAPDTCYVQVGTISNENIDLNHTFTTPQYDARGIAFFLARESPVYEVTCPDRNIEMFQNGTATVGGYAGNFPGDMLVVQQLQGSSVNQRLFHAMGDDFTLGSFLAAPSVFEPV